jgi:hypothetical protein
MDLFGVCTRCKRRVLIDKGGAGSSDGALRFATPFCSMLRSASFARTGRKDKEKPPSAGEPELGGFSTDARAGLDARLCKYVQQSDSVQCGLDFVRAGYITLKLFAHLS